MLLFGSFCVWFGGGARAEILDHLDHFEKASFGTFLLEKTCPMLIQNAGTLNTKATTSPKDQIVWWPLAEASQEQHASQIEQLKGQQQET